ncbi:hypothetical protein C8Q73DRAFT_674162 [Cubamyces lactineus]|nr:hypothetical protein C8Q73DRAFT_674162 [Cubamyces lactineus]
MRWAHRGPEASASVGDLPLSTPPHADKWSCALVCPRNVRVARPSPRIPIGSRPCTCSLSTPPCPFRKVLSFAAATVSLPPFQSPPVIYITIYASLRSSHGREHKRRARQRHPSHPSSCAGLCVKLHATRLASQGSSQRKCGAASEQRTSTNVGLSQGQAAKPQSHGRSIRFLVKRLRASHQARRLAAFPCAHPCASLQRSRGRPGS